MYECFFPLWSLPSHSPNAGQGGILWETTVTIAARGTRRETKKLWFLPVPPSAGTKPLEDGHLVVGCFCTVVTPGSHAGPFIQLPGLCRFSAESQEGTEVLDVGSLSSGGKT